MVSLAGMDGMLVYVAWVGSVARLRGWRTNKDGMLLLFLLLLLKSVGGVLAWMAWVVYLCGCQDSVGGMGGILTWEVC